ncbi:hypothetical protein MTO96_031377 [Rhipicephalus appendiculatus]
MYIARRHRRRDLLKPGHAESVLSIETPDSGGTRWSNTSEPELAALHQRPENRRHKMAAGQLRRRLTMLVGIAILYAVAMAVEVAARKVSDIRPTIEEAQEHANQLAQMLAKLKSNLVVSVTDDL